MLVAVTAPAVIAFIATDRDRKNQWRGWSS